MDQQDERLTDTIHVPLTPTLRAEINRLAMIEDRKPAAIARRLILAGLAVKQEATEVRHAT